MKTRAPAGGGPPSAAWARRLRNQSRAAALRSCQATTSKPAAAKWPRSSAAVTGKEISGLRAQGTGDNALEIRVRLLLD